MLVSAISQNMNRGLKVSNNMPFNNRNGENVKDTYFNSLTPNIARNTNRAEKSSQTFDSINEWQNFCHKQILGGNLNVIA